MYLGDLGADVIKVERPGGEDARQWGPPFVDEDSAWFLSANRGKRSICLDIRVPAGREVLMRLLERADVLIVSFNPSKLASLGLDPPTLTNRFPRLIYCALSGFGLSGPDSSLPGYDLIAQARSGLMSVTGAAGDAPQRVSTALTDVMAGTVAAMAIVAAIVGRTRSGKGQAIDVSLLDAALALMAPRIASFGAGEPEPRPSGATDSVLSIYQTFPTADRPVVVAVGNDSMWERFCNVVGLSELAGRPDLQTNAGRRDHRDELISVIAEQTAVLPSQVLLERLHQAAIPCSPVQFLNDVLTDPQVVARRSIRPIAHPGPEVTPIVAQPWRIVGETQHDTLPAAPALGQHGVNILLEVGCTDDEIDRLIEEGALWADLTKTP
jgi:crotonobetainyl-CoA:carnitine CoA-transferase CaiB-like acyl-CoA transferase